MNALFINKINGEKVFLFFILEVFFRLNIVSLHKNLNKNEQ